MEMKKTKQRSVGKRFATIFWNDDISAAHLYKDVGGIPYALAKYCGWQTTLVYSDINGRLQDEKYEKYVQLRTIHYSKACQRMKLKWLKYFRVMQFVWRHAADYDVLNFYHVDKLIMFLCWLAKKRNPLVFTYVKMDMEKAGLQSILSDQKKGKRRIRHIFIHSVDLFTVETRQYAELLAKKTRFFRRTRYLPNGYFSEWSTGARREKENMLLTVGLLGTWQKNTELFVESLTQISPERLQGEVKDKAQLSQFYQRAKVFILSSREESWGLVVSEAMAEDDYIVVTDCCDAFHEYIDTTEEHGFGKIVPNEDAVALRGAIEEVLDGRVDAVRRGGQAGKYAREHLDWKVVAKELDCLLRMKSLKA